MANDYLQTTDITDKVAVRLVTQDYVDRAANEFLDLVEILFLGTSYYVNDRDEMIAKIHTPLHYTIRRWMVSWTTKMIFQETMYVNNVDVSTSEKYYQKYLIYEKEESLLRDLITAEMVLGTVADSASRAPITGIIYRG